MVTPAIDKVGVVRSTFYKWMKEDPEFKKAVEDVENVAIDFAESQLHLQIRTGVPASTIFYLKTKGKKRGYIEKQAVDITTGGNTLTGINITIHKAGDPDETDGNKS